MFVIIESVPFSLKEVDTLDFFFHSEDHIITRSRTDLTRSVKPSSEYFTQLTCIILQYEAEKCKKNKFELVMLPLS